MVYQLRAPKVLVLGSRRVLPAALCDLHEARALQGVMKTSLSSRGQPKVGQKSLQYMEADRG